MSLELERMEELLKMATPAPWKASCPSFYEDESHGGWIGKTATCDDCQFITAARTFIPEAIARIREVEAELKSVEAELKMLEEHEFGRRPE